MESKLKAAESPELWTNYNRFFRPGELFGTLLADRIPGLGGARVWTHVRREFAFSLPNICQELRLLIQFLFDSCLLYNKKYNKNKQL